MDISIISAPPNPATAGGKGSPELREERGWKKYLLQRAQAVGRSKDAALNVLADTQSLAIKALYKILKPRSLPGR